MKEERPKPHARSDYVVFRPIATRWMDNDAYGHVNNAVYYSWFDTAVSGWLCEQRLVVPHVSPVVGYAVNSSCDYFDAVSFPEAVESGLRIDTIGRSSVRYGVAIFRAGASQAAAQGQFTHVYVDAVSRRPVDLPVGLRNGLSALVRSEATPRRD